MNKWKRFWNPKGNFLRLLNGFLINPEDDWNRLENPKIQTFEDINQNKSLILLGDSGIGKTTTLNQEFEKLLAEKGEDKVLWLNLFARQSEEGFLKYIFENKTIKKWQYTDDELYLFLDGFEEGIAKLSTIPSLLIDEFKNLPIERLNIRLICRSNSWLYTYQEQFESIWKELKVFELAPLRINDVENDEEFIKLKESGVIETQKFFNELQQNGITHLASKPLTLGFILNYIKNKQKLPSNIIELYENGCLLHCQEHDERKYGEDSFSPEMRLIIASRIAVMSLLSNNFGFWVDPDQGNVPEGFLKIRDLIGNSENLEGAKFNIDENAIREAFSTGLFYNFDSGTKLWNHYSFAEFLAARYLNKNEISIKQISNFFIHPTEEKIFPQFRGTISWLAGMNKDVFDMVLKLEPDILLQSVVSHSSDEERKRVIDSILYLYSTDNKIYSIFDSIYYSKFNHKDLEAQLLPFITNKGNNVSVRMVAIDFAEESCLSSFQRILADIALDENEQNEVRTRATIALKKLADENVKLKFKNLALNGSPKDEDEELKGYALSLVWPNYLTAQEFFDHFKEPRKPRFYGGYKGFIKNYLAVGLRLSDLPIALNWLKNTEIWKGSEHDFYELAKETLVKGFSNLSEPTVLSSLTELLLSKIDSHIELYFGEARKLDTENRRLLLKSLINTNTVINDNMIFSILFNSHLISEIDITWYIKQFESETDENIKKAWCFVLRNAFFRTENIELVDFIINNENEPLIFEIFNHYLGKIIIRSDNPEELKKGGALKKEYYKYDRKPQKIVPEKILLDPPPSERIKYNLENFKKGELGSWLHINRDMTLEVDSTHYLHVWELHTELTSLPGWLTANNEEKQNILNTAKEFILKYTPHSEEVKKSGGFSNYDLAGYRALMLVKSEDNQYLKDLPINKWKEWAPIILAFPMNYGFGGEQPHQELVKMAYLFAPEEILETLNTLIDKENSESQGLFIIYKMKYCWDKRLIEFIINKIEDPSLAPENIFDLLKTLILNDSEKGKEIIENFISPENIKNSEEKAVKALACLILYSNNAGLETLIKFKQDSEEFLKNSLLSAAESAENRHFMATSKLNEKQTANLYSILVELFPYSSDPDDSYSIRDVKLVTSRDSVEWWRNNLLQQLENFGTKEARSEILDLINKFPELTWLKNVLIRANRNFIANQLKSITPKMVLEILKNDQKRVAENGEQLLAVIIESLERLEEKLQGETPSAKFLWNDNKPKIENDLADFIKNHLEDELSFKGIISGREVEIRKNEGNRTGEEVDIHVNAITPNKDDSGFNVITVIIEVKGCWNRNLETDMENQLMNRYLKDNSCNYGLYLIGWYNCTQWDEKDYRKKDFERKEISSLETARSFFNNQADNLSQRNNKVIKAFVLNASLR